MVGAMQALIRVRKSSVMYSYVIVIVFEAIILAGISFALMCYVKTAESNMLDEKAYEIAHNVREHILEMYSIAIFAEKPERDRYLVAAMYLDLPTSLGKHNYAVHVKDVNHDGIYDVIVDIHDIGHRVYVSCMIENSSSIRFEGRMLGSGGIYSIACYIYANGTMLFILSNTKLLSS